MNLSENHFKKFLCDEILRKSHCSVKDALNEVNEFSKSERFPKTYENWKILELKYAPKHTRPLSFKEIMKRGL